MSPLVTRLADADVKDLPDWQVAEMLSAPDPAHGTKRRDVPTATVRGMLLASGEWGAIVILSRQPVTVAQLAAQEPEALAVAAAITALATLEHTATLEATNSAYWNAMQAMVAGMQAVGVMSKATGDALLALAETPQSWAEANGYSAGVTARDVSLARGGRA